MMTGTPLKIICYALWLVCFSFVVVYSPNSVFAQSQNDTSSSSDKKKRDRVEKMSSLFFTYWQHQAILDAKNSRGVVRAPTQAELDAMINSENDVRPDPGPRDINLGGIVYNGEDDWTIWLNSQRVTPDAVPAEVMDLRVFNEYIEVKWLDAYTNQIFPIRLRVHERFNIDSRVFLPGN